MNSLSKEPNVIYVGRKPPMNYVLGILTSFSGSNTKEVTLKARGQAITTAIDAVEITRHKFMKDLGIVKITIGTEEMSPRDACARATRRKSGLCAYRQNELSLRRSGLQKL